VGNSAQSAGAGTAFGRHYNPFQKLSAHGNNIEFVAISYRHHRQAFRNDIKTRTKSAPED
jgi:hypothetical protein